MTIEQALRAEIEALRRYIDALEDAIRSGDDALGIIRLYRREYLQQPTRKVDVPSGGGE